MMKRYGITCLVLVVAAVLGLRFAVPAAAQTMSPLHACGRSLCNSSGTVVPQLRGFSVDYQSEPASGFSAIASEAGSHTPFVRFVVQWANLQPTNGAINASSSYVKSLDGIVSRATAAGVYLELELHLNGGQWPSWVTNHNMAAYVTSGKTATQFLANRYGNPSSPEYSPAVMGFGVNEPPVDNVNVSNVWPHLEGQERTMITWFRAAAPSWIGFVAGPYASATPIFNLPCARAGVAQNSYTNASTTAYDSVGGNVVLDMHDYQQGTTTAKTGFDGRAANGENQSYTKGGQVVKVGDLTPSSYPSPHNGTTSRTILESQMKAWVCPYATYAASYDGGKGIPLMAGEFGWNIGPSTTMLQRGTGDTAYAVDLMAALATGKPAILAEWDFSHAQANGQDPWAAQPSINGVDTWQPFTTSWEGL